MVLTLNDDDEIAIEKIIQIIESRTDLTPTEYIETRKTMLGKILQDKDLIRELLRIYSEHIKTEIAIREFVLSTNKLPE